MGWSSIKEILILIFMFVLTLIFYALRVWDLKSISHAVEHTLAPPHIIDISKQEWITDQIGMEEIHPKIQKIPKVIIQTNTDNLVWESLYLSAKNLQWYNPEYQYIYFDDERMLNFLTEHYSARFVSAYQTLVPGAYRSDVFRIAYLYKMGGVYFDTGFTCLKPLRNIIEANDVFICSEDNHQTDLNQNLCYLHNAFIASVPGHCILEKYLDLVLSHIEHKNYTRDVLSITGPGALGQAFHQFNPKSLPGVIHTPEGTLRILQSTFYERFKTAIIAKSDSDMMTDPYFYSKTLSYREEQKRYALPRYAVYYQHKQVFGEPGPLPTQKIISECSIQTNCSVQSEYRWFALSYPKNQEICPFILPTDIPAIIKTQKSVKNIIIPISSSEQENMTWDQYHSIMTFVYLNPEYHFYFNESVYDLISSTDREAGWRFEIGDVCMIPLREFIAPHINQVMVDNVSLCTPPQKSDNVLYLETRRGCVSDGLEFGGVPNRCLFYKQNKCLS